MSSIHLDDTRLGPLGEAVRATTQRLLKEGLVRRIWDRDHTVWNPDPTEISNRLAWLDSPSSMPAALEEIDALVDDVRNAGYTQALLMGMGGSSLAPEVFRKVFGAAHGYLDLAVLDSTAPGAVLSHARRLEPTETLFIAATKSGGTVETISFLKYFYNLAAEALGSAASAGEHFAAITDPGSGLADLASELNFRHIFLNEPDIGGRYSALSLFGLVPARLSGIDVALLLSRASDAAGEAAGDEAGPSLVLGAALGVAALAGRDKLTLVLSPSIAPLGAWIEQLIAESTGKEGKGILPIDGEVLGGPEVYAEDRLFVDVRLSGDDAHEARLEELAGAGHPVLQMEMADPIDLGAAMFQWEMATIIAGHCMGINPFDQPDVEAAKVVARTMTSAYLEDGALPAVEAAFTDGDLTVFGEVEGPSLAAALRSFLSAISVQEGARSYVAIQAYVNPTPETDVALGELRQYLRDRLRLATTVGYGPRFLHSTGQLHKGDGGHGLFLQLTGDGGQDAPIPDAAGAPESRMSFGVLKRAQAMGDAQALQEAGRQVLRVDLGEDIVGGIRRLTAAARDS